ncbi:MAG TPA: nucleotide exchange factor GrpE, partial [Methylococcaceae bacterium]|nr:nucleotide exchange factor GrpE [Methylococcaceae bacterium]
MGSDEQTDQENIDQSTMEQETKTVEEVVDETVELNEETEVVDLQAELEAAKARADENWEKVLLAKAEVENIRRRTQKDVEKAHRFSVEK